MKTLRKTAMLTDIHFGRRHNSDEHNQDCLDFIAWFCDNVREDPEIDSIAFLGDWFENRSSVDVKTMHYSYRGAKMLDELGLPVFYCVGNHDLYQRNSRDIFSTAVFHELKNFHVIQKPTVIKHLGDGSLLAPYLFHDEYGALGKYSSLGTWFGHFEFRGFQVTGYNMVMHHGPDHMKFIEGPKRIFSGHFHKRQVCDNVAYIGNTFPMDFGDAGDNSRGMAVYDHSTDILTFIDWEQCPKFVKTTLSELLDGKIRLHPKTRVRCAVDEQISFSESSAVKQHYLKKFHLREITLDESAAMKEALTETELEQELDAVMTVDEMIVTMLENIKTEHIDNSMLLNIYKDL